MTQTENIRMLLEKFYDGLTTETEEKTLHDYFRQGNDVAEELKEEQLFFRAMQPEDCPVPVALGERLARQINQWNTVEKTARRSSQRASLRWITAAAASLLLVVSVSVFVYHGQGKAQQPPQDTYTNQEDAYAQTSKALLKFSKSLNKGIEKAQEITPKQID